MRFVITGGGTGGHFYPLIAVMEEVRRIAAEEGVLAPHIYYFSDTPYDEELLYELDIEFRRVRAGKLRRYGSAMNIFDMIKTLVAIPGATIKLFGIYPDALFSKGGYASVPTVIAAWLLRIPIFIHESDAIPGRANMLAARFAHSIAISFPEAADFFAKDDPRLALTGVPIRKALMRPAGDAAHHFLNLNADIPTILFLGGSSGAERLNSLVVQALPMLLEHYQVIHQTGKTHFTEVESSAALTLNENPLRDRYRPIAYLNALSLTMASSAADIIVSRAGATAIFEIAAWGKPAILIPIPEDISHDQRTNAYAYARTGAAEVIEEGNMAPHVLTAELNRLMHEHDTRARMSEAAHTFTRPDAAEKIARELLALGLEHEN